MSLVCKANLVERVHAKHVTNCLPNLIVFTVFKNFQDLGKVGHGMFNLELFQILVSSQAIHVENGTFSWDKSEKPTLKE